MAIRIDMPSLSPTMETGTLSKWLVKEGDKVDSGDIIAEIETDKATMEVDVADEGKIGKLLVDEGTEDIKVGKPIAILLEEGEDKSALDDVSLNEDEEEEKNGKEGKKDEKKEEKKEEKDKKKEKAPKKKDHKKKPSKPEKEKSSKNNGRTRASPLARRLAEKANISLEDIEGSGPNGRIIKRDIEKAKEEGVKPGEEAGEKVSLEPPKEEMRINNVRKISAKRLLESKQTIPHYYLSIEADITKLLELRKEINDQLEDEKVSVNDFIIKALAISLMKVPEAHVQWADDKMYQFRRADISVAVAIEGGLITPIIRNANEKSMKAISREMKELAEKARDGKLQPEEYQGGTFSLSNLGMFGIKDFAAVINPPQAGILAIGAGGEKPLLVDGELQNRTFMGMTGSFDHRAIDGAVGAQLMKTIKDVLENPAILLY